MEEGWHIILSANKHWTGTRIVIHLATKEACIARSVFRTVTRLVASFPTVSADDCPVLSIEIAFSVLQIVVIDIRTYCSHFQITCSLLVGLRRWLL